MGNSFGKLFSITTFGESHGGGIGVVVDGCPPMLPLDENEIQAELDRRRPGQSSVSTPRKEADRVRFLSGVFEGKTLGTPIAMIVDNTDARPAAYDEMRSKFRPSHADFTYQEKYGIRNHEGGGRSSARETIGRVAAGVIAKKILSSLAHVEIRAYVESIHTISMAPSQEFPSFEAVEATAIRCPDHATAKKMIAAVENAATHGDSLGGVIACRIRNVPRGLGEPVFDRIDADLSKAMLSIPASKGIEFGLGFKASELKGSEHNDLFEIREGKIRTQTNKAGGMLGGITTGEEIFFRVAFKPTATISQPQKTVDTSGRETELIGRGRHDPCVLPRAVPIIEAMAALVLVDHLMRNHAQNRLL